jgi:hypothetical protein
MIVLEFIVSAILLGVPMLCAVVIFSELIPAKKSTREKLTHFILFR